MAGQPSSNKHTMERLASQHEKYKKGYYFPSDDIDPKLKKGEWCRQWQESIWSLFINNSCFSSIADYQWFRLLRLYGAGKQPNNIYMDLLLNDETINPDRTGFLSTNWEVFSPMPKFKRLIRGRFGQQDYMYSATAVDPTSQAKKEDKKWDIWYNSQYGEIEAEIIKKVHGMDQQEQQAKYIAKSLEELDLFNEMGGIKLQEEAEIETVLEATDYLSDIQTIKNKCLDDLVDLGRAAYRDSYNPITGLVTKEYVDWENLIIDYSNETDFKDIRFWSYIKFETLNNVRVRSGLKEEEILKLARINCGYWGNMDNIAFNSYQNNQYRNEKGVRIYNQFRVPILISEWLSTDTDYFKTYKTKKGVEVTIPQEEREVFNTPNKKTKVVNVNNVYNSTWIIGSNHVYEDGLSLNIARPNPKEPKLSIHASVLPGKSITETIKANLDQLALCWVRWQSAIAQASPSGYNWDLTQLEGIDLGMGGDMKPIQLVNLKRHTGDTFTRSISIPGKYNNGAKPVTRNEGGIGEMFNEIITTMDVNFKYIADLTGIDLISGASMKPGETTATEVKHASIATNDALQPLFTSWVQMQEHSGQTVAAKIQRAIKYHPEAKEAYEGILGRVGAKVLSIGADTTAAEFGIKIELKSNKEMVAFAMQTVLESKNRGENGGVGITSADAYYFVDLIQRGRVKTAMALFNYKETKAKTEALKLQRENMQLNSENQIKSDVAKAEGKIQITKAEGDVDLKIEAAKALLQMNVDNNSSLNAMKEKLIEKILTSDSSSSQPAQPQMGMPAA